MPVLPASWQWGISIHPFIFFQPSIPSLWSIRCTMRRKGTRWTWWCFQKIIRNLHNLHIILFRVDSHEFHIFHNCHSWSCFSAIRAQKLDIISFLFLSPGFSYFPASRKSFIKDKLILQSLSYIIATELIWSFAKIFRTLNIYWCYFTWNIYKYWNIFILVLPIKHPKITTPPLLSVSWYREQRDC